MEYVTADIRRFLAETFGDEELKILCFDYFRDVYDDFTTGMMKTQMIQLLMERCVRREALPSLDAALRAERPIQYEKRFGSPEPTVIPAETAVAGRDPRQVFISHAHQDAEFAHRLAGDLRSAGWRAWIAPDSIQPGEKWVEAIGRGLDESGIFLVVLTPAAVGSRWVRKETNSAVALEVRGEVHFVTLEVEACAVPTLWDDYQRVPFRGRYEDGLVVLLCRLAGGLAARETPEAKPVIGDKETRRQVGKGSKQEAVPEEAGKTGKDIVHQVKSESMEGEAALRPSELPLDYAELHILAVLRADPHRVAVRDIVIRSGLPADFTRRSLAVLKEKGYVRQDSTDKVPSDHDEATYFTEQRKQPEIDRRVTAHQQAERERRQTEVRARQVAAARIDFDWVTIPAGEFLMGSDKTKDKLAYDDETPQHTLYLPEYRIARVPVTVAQFAAFMAANPGYRTTAEQEGSAWSYTGSKWDDVKGADWAHPRGPKSDVRAKQDHPVTCVSWHDSVAFCKWAGVRLPSEVEWEKAARGTDGRIWPWGNWEPNNGVCNFNMTVGDTTPVGRYPDGVSPYGLLDVAGNVWEWTSSLFKPYKYDAGDGREDPKSDGNRALRGGSFWYGAQRVRCAYRGRLDPFDRFDHDGFRVVSPGS